MSKLIFLPPVNAKVKILCSILLPDIILLAIHSLTSGMVLSTHCVGNLSITLLNSLLLKFKISAPKIFFPKSFTFENQIF